MRKTAETPCKQRAFPDPPRTAAGPVPDRFPTNTPATRAASATTNLEERLEHRASKRVGQFFVVCGEDKVWHWAKGTVQGKDKVEVWSDKVANPIAVRYAWADNPVCNLFSNDGLPVTPFRTDDFDMTTKPKTKPPARQSP